MLILGIISWYLSGVFSFIYWWTSDYDYRGTDIPITLLMGIAGPIAFLMGWCIHSKKNTRVLIKMRANKNQRLHGVRP